MSILNFQAQSRPSTGLAGVLESVKAEVNNAGQSNARAVVARNVFAHESIAPDALLDLQNNATKLQNALESICQTALPLATGAKGLIGGVANSTVSKSQMAAGLYAMLMGGDLKHSVGISLASNVIATEGLKVIPAEVEGLTERRAATEAYDEQSVATSVAFSVAYNLAACRQDEFGEALFPTVVIPPDQAGLMMSVDMVMLQNDARRKLDGGLTDWNRHNVIRAQIHPELLQNDQTQLVPVLRDETKQHFVDTALIAEQVVKTDAGDEIPTSYLAMDAAFDLIAVSQTDALLQQGTLDASDSIEPSVSLKNLALKLVSADGTKKQAFDVNTDGYPYSTFNLSVQNNTRMMVLNFDANELVITKNQVALSAEKDLLDPLAAGAGYEVRLAISVSGNINLQFGNTSLYTNKVRVTSVRSDGQDLSLATGAGKTIADVFVGAEFVGYKLDSRRSNLNRRQRGQLVDTTTYRQYYQVPLLPPVTVPRPHSAGDMNDAKDLAALVFTTHVRASNAAVDKLLQTAGLLKSTLGTQARFSDKAETLGMARWLLDPFYEEIEYNAPDVVDSIKSHERAADIQASLVNILRDVSYRMYQETGYKPAADSQNGGMSAPPTVIIATDQVISRYLTVTGDLRTLGDQFPVKIVSTANERMRGKIFVTFGDFSTAEAGVPNILHFGTMQWRPELTVILPTHREGQNSKEISVSPSFRHHVNLPILALINVKGIKDTVSKKMPINFHPVP